MKKNQKFKKGGPITLPRLSKSFRIRIIFLLTALSLQAIQSFAQESTGGFWSGWSVNLNGGANLFYGDVENPEIIPAFTDKNEWRFGYGLLLQKRFSPVFQVRGQLFNGQLSGSKKKNNYWFEGDVIETSLSLRADVLNIFRDNKNAKFSLYLMAGVGLAHWKTELKDFETNEVIDENGTNNSGSGLFGRTVEGVIPFGGGISYQFNDHWSALMEISLRPVNSDKLDAKVGMFEYDFYSYDFIGISYHFTGRKPKAPQPIEEEIAIEQVEPQQEEPIVIKEPEPAQEIEEPVKEIPEKPKKSLDDQLLDKEYRTGLYESPWPGINFTVQIAASRKFIEPSEIAKKYNIEGDVITNEASGWYRYSVGDYLKYWKAREYRNILVTRNNIKDAFVVAYRNGQRVTLSQLVESNTGNSDEERAAEKQRNESKISYSVQVLASSNGNISPQAIREMFDIDTEVIREEQNGLYQYTAGIFNSYNEAAKMRNKLKARGISGAFVVGYKDGVRTDIKALKR